MPQAGSHHLVPLPTSQPRDCPLLAGLQVQLFHPQSHAVHISAAAVLWQDFGGLDEALPAGGALVVQTTTTTDVTTVTVRAANVGNGTLVFGGEMEVGGLGTWDSGVAVGQRHKVPW